MGKDIQTASKSVPIERNMMKKGDYFKIKWTLKNINGTQIPAMVGECLGKEVGTDGSYKFRLLWTDSSYLITQFSKLPSEMLIFHLPFKYMEGYCKGNTDVVKSFELLSEAEALTYKL